MSTTACCKITCPVRVATKIKLRTLKVGFFSLRALARVIDPGEAVIEVDCSVRETHIYLAVFRHAIWNECRN